MDNLRIRMAKAVMKSLDIDHEMGENYDPDMCYRTADRVTAEILSELTGYHYKAEFHPNIIGPAQFVHDGEYYG